MPARITRLRRGLRLHERQARWPRACLPLVPALEEGAAEGAAEQVEHQEGGRRFLVDLDSLGVEGEDREDVAVPPVALGRPRADVARHPGVVFELKGALREP